MYLDRYWEMFNEIDGDFDDVAIRTFKDSLPAEHYLRESLTKKPVRSVRLSWTVLMSINGLRKTSNKAKGKLRLYLRI